MSYGIFSSLVLCALVVWQLLTFESRVESNMKFLERVFGKGPQDRQIAERAAIITAAICASAAFVFSTLRF